MSVFGVATTKGQVERLVEQLQAEGFAVSENSVLMPEYRRDTDIGRFKATKAPEGATTGAATGGVTGGPIGLLAGLAPWRFLALVRLLRPALRRPNTLGRLAGLRKRHFR